MLIALLLTAFDPASFEVATQKAITEWKAPGAAVSIVQDGKVLLVKGFGVRKQGEGALVDEHTVFQFGSLTKGFTAAVVAKLVSEKKIAFDDPVQKHFPSFALADAALTKQLTVRDLLAHTTGMQPEVDWLWAAGAISAQELLSRLRFAKASTPLRSEFSYHNVTYAVLGEVITKVAGQPWEQVIKQGLLRPLKMDDAGFGLPAGSNVASAHDDASGENVVTPFLDGVAVGPAAAANGSISDLSVYLLHLLATENNPVFVPQTVMPLGPYSKRVFTESHLREYAMGWVLQDHRGKLIIWNTGGMNGQSCSIAIVPELRLGVAVLTNQGRTSLPEALVFEAIDRALGVAHKDWSAERLRISLEGREKKGETKATSNHDGRYKQPLLGEVVIKDNVVSFVGATGDLRSDDKGELIVWRTPFFGTSRVTFSKGALDIEAAGRFAR